MTIDWQGVFPALMTEFKPDESLDLEATARHIEAMLAAGCSGLVMLGTLGENTSLSANEKRAVIEMAVSAVAGRVPVISGVAEYTSALACAFVRDIEALGANGAMVLPPMVYKTDPRETLMHFRGVAAASSLPVMIYNNPVSYGTDVSPAMFAELADAENIIAIKESSDDPRRLTDIVNACGQRYTLFCGVDDIIVESVAVGAVGWVAGLVNAFPAESVRLFELARAGNFAEARALYRWFMPLLHLDTDAKLVQLIKLANAMTGLGSETVRAPRLKLEGAERAEIEALIARAIETRPELAAKAAAE
ncbi:MAG TPA: dihydrodipicolinate synthase family protein [Alphaproteobacteria bacterium]|nr:dihydrodipicolinate synthase family protein [Alphaproteobacteria bacterium]